MSLLNRCHQGRADSMPTSRRCSPGPQRILVARRRLGHPQGDAELCQRRERGGPHARDAVLDVARSQGSERLGEAGSFRLEFEGHGALYHVAAVCGEWEGKGCGTYGQHAEVCRTGTKERARSVPINCSKRGQSNGCY